MSTDGRPTSTRCWPSAIAAADPPAPPLPAQLSVSTLVELGRDPDAARSGCAAGCRPGPTHMRCWAPHFTTGCSGSSTPSGCSTSTTCPAPSIATSATPKSSPNCRPRSRCPPWAARTPIDVEVPFDMVIGGRVVRGRIDAVFADDDGGMTVVDWKTGEPPDTQEAKQQAAIQLAVYRLAWARAAGLPGRVGARGVPLRAQPGRRSRPTTLPERRRTRRAADGRCGLGAAVDLERLR